MAAKWPLDARFAIPLDPFFRGPEQGRTAAEENGPEFDT
jgi:hypothetical protein